MSRLVDEKSRLSGDRCTFRNILSEGSAATLPLS
jgi:hypothetical protein